LVHRTYVNGLAELKMSYKQMAKNSKWMSNEIISTIAFWEEDESD